MVISHLYGPRGRRVIKFRLVCIDSILSLRLLLGHEVRRRLACYSPREDASE